MDGMHRTARAIWNRRATTTAVHRGFVTKAKGGRLLNDTTDLLDIRGLGTERLNFTLIAATAPVNTDIESQAIFRRGTLGISGFPASPGGEDIVA